MYVNVYLLTFRRMESLLPFTDIGLTISKAVSCILSAESATSTCDNTPEIQVKVWCACIWDFHFSMTLLVLMMSCDW